MTLQSEYFLRVFLNVQNRTKKKICFFSPVSILSVKVKIVDDRKTMN